VTVPIEVIMPAMEMNQQTAGLVRWLKEPGSYVTAGEPLMEVETDKVTVQIEAMADGMLSDIRFGPGDEVPVGAVVALLVPEASVGESGGAGPVVR
jgi:pyruvate/2-oxoglutarate dehydrogenase complex dihydrolipoamide acyltransferase (E2) component